MASANCGANINIYYRTAFCRKSLHVFRDKSQCVAVVAPTLTGWGWTVVEDVAVMAAAFDAVVFGARENQFEVSFGDECVWYRLENTWPTGAAVEFHHRGKQRQGAAGAKKYTGPFFVVERTRERAFGIFLAQHCVLL